MEQVMQPNHAVRHHRSGDRPSKLPEACQRRALSGWSLLEPRDSLGTGSSANEMVLGQVSLNRYASQQACLSSSSGPAACQVAMLACRAWIQRQYRLATYSETLLAFGLEPQ